MKSMKRRTLGLLLAAIACVAPSTLAAMGSGEPAPTITVIGQGSVQAEPDQASISVGVQLYNESAQGASAELQTRMDQVIAAIRAIGIPDSRIQTMNYSISFERDYQMPLSARSDTGNPVGMYRVENMVQVVIDDVTRVADVVGAAIDAGANQMYGIQFTFSNERELDDQARTQAMEDARRRAETLATAAGRSVGKVIDISEAIGGATTPYVARAMGMGGGPVQPGQNTYAANVQVTYELR